VDPRAYLRGSRTSARVSRAACWYSSRDGRVDNVLRSVWNLERPNRDWPLGMGGFATSARVTMTICQRRKRLAMIVNQPWGRPDPTFTPSIDPTTEHSSPVA